MIEGFTKWQKEKERGIRAYTPLTTNSWTPNIDRSFKHFTYLRGYINNSILYIEIEHIYSALLKKLLN
jgi:hypothetical protein